MKLKALSAVGNKFGRQALILQKHSPAIMFGVGVTGVVATVVLACRGTLKLEEVLAKSQGEIEMSNRARELDRPDYQDLDQKKDKALIYTRMVVDVTRLYLPAIIVGVASIGALTGAQLVLNRRNMAVTAAYATLDKGFREYRQRVIDELGEDKDKEFRYATQDHEIIEEGENGPVTKTVKRVGLPDGKSIYARCFDETNPKWKKEMSYNQVLIQCQQNYANDRLRAKGHLFLNDVYRALGFEDTKEGQIVGWVWNGDGDNYVDFGVFEGDEFSAIQFVEGEEPSIWLDFNVDGVVWDKI